MPHSPTNPHIGVTSNEPVGEKHLVLPYDERPMVGGNSWRRKCLFCGNPGFRRSRPRLMDLPRMVLLQWPLRCTRCGQRQHASFFRAIASRGPRPHDGDAAVGPHSWGEWTGQPSPNIVLAAQPAPSVAPAIQLEEEQAKKS